MSVTFSIYFCLPDHKNPNHFDQWRLFEEAGLKFQSSGFYYNLIQGCILDSPGQSIVESLQDFDRLAPEMRSSLVQQWEHEDGGGWTLGYVRIESVMVGVMRFLASDIDALSQSLINEKYGLPQLLGLMMSTLGVHRLLAVSDAAITDANAVDLLLGSDFEKCCGFSGVCGIGGLSQICSEKFINYSDDKSKLYLNWPFE